ncbi:MAG: hypothetical protein FJ118_13970 [Deltaproteobacteria bacterium]|nr:hypothetical protein [Deltaproteobacteria bacterium]
MINHRAAPFEIRLNVGSSTLVLASVMWLLLLVPVSDSFGSEYGHGPRRGGVAPGWGSIMNQLQRQAIIEDYYATERRFNEIEAEAARHLADMDRDSSSTGTQRQYQAPKEKTDTKKPGQQATQSSKDKIKLPSAKNKDKTKLVPVTVPPGLSPTPLTAIGKPGRTTEQGLPRADTGMGANRDGTIPRISKPPTVGPGFVPGSQPGKTMTPGATQPGPITRVQPGFGQPPGPQWVRMPPFVGPGFQPGPAVQPTDPVGPVETASKPGSAGLPGGHTSPSGRTPRGESASGDTWTSAKPGTVPGKGPGDGAGGPDSASALDPFDKSRWKPSTNWQVRTVHQPDPRSGGRGKPEISVGTEVVFVELRPAIYVPDLGTSVHAEERGPAVKIKFVGQGGTMGLGGAFPGKSGWQDMETREPVIPHDFEGSGTISFGPSIKLGPFQPVDSGAVVTFEKVRFDGEGASDRKFGTGFNLNPPSYGTEAELRLTGQYKGNWRLVRGNP